MEDIGQKEQKMAILVKNGQILTIFYQKMDNFEFSTKNEKWRILGILGVQLDEKNQKKIGLGHGSRSWLELEDADA